MNLKGTEEKNDWTETDQVKQKTKWQSIYNHTVLLNPSKYLSMQHFVSFLAKKKQKKNFPTVKYPSFGVQYISRLHQNFKIGHSSHLHNTQVPWKMLVGLALKHETPACPIKWTYIFFFSCKTKLVVNCTLWEEGGSGGGVGGITATVINTTSFIHYCSRPVYSLLVHWRPHVYFT